MGILTRFADIMGANLNAILSKLEGANADKLLEKYLQDARENLGQIRSETAVVIAEEMSVARKLAENDELQKKYTGYATAAVKAGNDDDARKFLAHNMELQSQHTELEKAYDLAKSNGEKMRQMTAKLTSDIETMEAKLDELKQKLLIAKQQEKLNAVHTKLENSSVGNYDNLLDAVQKRIDTAEAQSQLREEAETAAKDIDELAKKYETGALADNGSQSIEQQLARMKAEIADGNG